MENIAPYKNLFAIQQSKSKTGIGGSYSGYDNTAMNRLCTYIHTMLFNSQGNLTSLPQIFFVHKYTCCLMKGNGSSTIAMGVVLHM